jgi:hypothetical protein
MFKTGIGRPSYGVFMSQSASPTSQIPAQTQTMIDNLPAKTGRSLDEWFQVLDAAAIPSHGAAMAYLKSEHGMTHGFANLVVSLFRARGQEAPSDEDLVVVQYSGKKAALRPVLDRIVAIVEELGPDVEIAPKKTGVSLRRSKQFALVEVPSAARVTLGLNLRGVPGGDRLREVTGMCTHRVDLASVDDVDADVEGWLREAYERA